MKNVSMMSLMFVLLTAGCVNVGGKVALIGDSEEISDLDQSSFRLSIYEKPNTSSLLIAANKERTYEREILQKAIEKYNEKNRLSEQDDGSAVEVKLSFSRQQIEDSLDTYEFVSGIFTFFTLGIWPTIMSDELYCTVKMQNDSRNVTVPVKIKKRYVYGWLSLFPVPGIAEWRGQKRDTTEGEAIIVKNAVVNNLRQFMP